MVNVTALPLNRLRVSDRTPGARRDLQHAARQLPDHWRPPVAHRHRARRRPGRGPGRAHGRDCERDGQHHARQPRRPHTTLRWSIHPSLECSPALMPSLASHAVVPFPVPAGSRLARAAAAPRTLPPPAPASCSPTPRTTASRPARPPPARSPGPASTARPARRLRRGPAPSPAPALPATKDRGEWLERVALDGFWSRCRSHCLVVSAAVLMLVGFHLCLHDANTADGAAFVGSPARTDTTLVALGRSGASLTPTSAPPPRASTTASARRAPQTPPSRSMPSPASVSTDITATVATGRECQSAGASDMPADCAAAENILYRFSVDIPLTAGGEADKKDANQERSTRELQSR